MPKAIFYLLKGDYRGIPSKDAYCLEVQCCNGRVSLVTAHAGRRVAHIWLTISLHILIVDYAGPLLKIMIR